jgi:hypothetical protein
VVINGHIPATLFQKLDPGAGLNDIPFGCFAEHPPQSPQRRVAVRAQSGKAQNFRRLGCDVIQPAQNPLVRQTFESVRYKILGSSLPSGGVHLLGNLNFP